MMRRAVRRLVGTRRAAAAVEFGLVGFAFFGFIFVILNLGLLGFSLGALSRGVQTAARAAALATANQYTTTQAYTAPSACTVDGFFDGIADPPFKPSGTSTSSNPKITISWVNNSANLVATEPPGLYVAITGTYLWKPLGFEALFSGITLKISSVATVPGTNGTAATITTGTTTC